MNNKVREKKSGFTLIEILAVIVILGIILFLAVPAVIGLIEKSKGKLAVTSAIEYINEIENKALMNDEVDYYGKFSTSDLNELDKSNGSKPTAGFMQINEEEKVVNGTFCIDNYKIHYDGKEAKIDYDSSCDTIKSFVEVIYFNPNTGLKCNEKESSSISETKNGCMKWYLYSYNGDSTVDMILDHNTSNTVEWNSTLSSNDGPTYALFRLSQDTSSWEGVPIRTDIYEFNSKEDNYSINYAGYRAKLLSLSEILSFFTDNDQFELKDYHYQEGFCFKNGKIINDYTCYHTKNIFPTISKFSFLYDNTEDCLSNGCEVEQSGSEGYWTADSANWTESIYYSNGGDRSWIVRQTGSFEAYQYYQGNVGIRPVITIPLSLLD